MNATGNTIRTNQIPRNILQFDISDVIPGPLATDPQFELPGIRPVKVMITCFVFPSSVFGLF
jgi:hypothetical protein